MADENALQELRSLCDGTIEFYRAELAKTKTGRASTGLVEGILVDYYGTKTPLSQLALISVAEARMLGVQVYDAGAVDAVEKAIHQADLGLNPSRDGNFIRIPIPALTEERRKEIVKRLHKQAEEMKVAIRGHRRTAIDQLQKEKKDGSLSEDDLNSLKKDVQAVTDSYVSQVDELLSKKEEEILEV
ncbi:ribosome recycling factor [bacterium]|nr:ribosome recycling factor [bacterium]